MLGKVSKKEVRQSAWSPCFATSPSFACTDATQPFLFVSPEKYRCIAATLDRTGAKRQTGKHNLFLHFGDSVSILMTF